MVKACQIRVNLHQEKRPDGLLNKAAYDLDIPTSKIHGIKVLRKSIDARKRKIMFNYKVEVYINEHGGVVNQDFKSLGLIPEDVTATERARMNEELADCFTKHKVNNFRAFYCSPTIIEPEEVQAQYEKCQNQGESEANEDEGVPDEDIPDFEFGFGTL